MYHQKRFVFFGYFAKIPKLRVIFPNRQQSGLKIVMDRPTEACEGFDESKFLFDFSALEFVQTDDDKFQISGSATIKENIEAPVKVCSPSVDENKFNLYR